MNHEPFLRRLPLFMGLSDADMDRVYSMAETLHVEAGTLVIEEGAPGDALYVILDGELEILKRSGGSNVVIATRVTGDVIGEMSLLEQAPRSASARALRPTDLLKISQASFRHLLAACPESVQEILRTVMHRLRSTESLLVQKEKMAALGTLAAGLAHELNNPASALARSTGQLREVIDSWQELSRSLGAVHMEDVHLEALHRLSVEMTRRAAEPDLRDPISRSNQESEMQEWLEQMGVERPWETAAALVSSGWDTSALREQIGGFPLEQLPIVLDWLATGGSTYVLLDESGKSAERISQIVRAVKSYAYLDQAPVKQVDVTAGIENTLVILRHKLKNGVRVRRAYDPELPHIEAYASELNQVWTNLIDNAIDAMEGQGELHIEASGKTEGVVVKIRDNGPGIQADNQSRIFEPFFTTKRQGAGTGLGLHIAYNIVVHKHHGQIQVESGPEGTSFTITLPLQQKQLAGSAPS